jgi:hypothetical protein
MGILNAGQFLFIFQIYPRRLNMETPRTHLKVSELQKCLQSNDICSYF